MVNVVESVNFNMAAQLSDLYPILCQVSSRHNDGRLLVSETFWNAAKAQVKRVNK